MVDKKWLPLIVLGGLWLLGRVKKEKERPKTIEEAIEKRKKEEVEKWRKKEEILKKIYAGLGK